MMQQTSCESLQMTKTESGGNAKVLAVWLDLGNPGALLEQACRLLRRRFEAELTEPCIVYVRAFVRV